MNKSIEQQALDAAQFCKCRGSVCHGCGPIIKDSFINGAKSRDAEWLKVVNELRSIILSQPRYTDNNQMEVVERDSFKIAMNRLAKADQMMKDMKL